MMRQKLALGSATGALIAMSACAPMPPPVGPAADSAGIADAKSRFPPTVTGYNTQPAPADGSMVPRSCPAPGSRVEQQGGPTMEFLGAVPGQPDLCRMKVGGEALNAWFGIWGADWAGGTAAYPAIKQSMQGPTGAVFGFNTYAKPGAQWHDLVRQEGIETISLLGKTYKAMRLAHYREGYGGNGYRSVSTVWKDVPTGLLIYGNYQHISGEPALDGQLIPAKIVPAQ